MPHQSTTQLLESEVKTHLKLVHGSNLTHTMIRDRDRGIQLCSHKLLRTFGTRFAVNAPGTENLSMARKTEIFVASHSVLHCNDAERCLRLWK